jgi:hypothetical protein
MISPIDVLEVDVLFVDVLELDVLGARRLEVTNTVLYNSVFIISNLHQLTHSFI